MQSATRPRLLLVAPMVPDANGVGLSMRLSVFADALARLGEVDTIVVPVFDAATGLPVAVPTPATVTFDVQSPAIDRGRASDSFALEPAPNGGFVNLGAYAAEIARAGIEGTPRGQIEAARSLAMSEAQVFLRVVLPPALARVWPAMTSQIVIVMLGSAVCGQIAAQELSYFANLIQSRNFRAFESFIVATAIYLALSVLLRQTLNWLGPKWIFGRVPQSR